MSRVSGVAMDSRFGASFSNKRNVGSAVVGPGQGITGGLPSQTVELGNYTDGNLGSWPISVSERWERLHLPKSRDELALLSWNTNGRLELRGCRESLLRRWARKGLLIWH